MAIEKPTTIDLETLKMLMAFFNPPPATSVSLNPNNSKEDALMGADIGRIKDDIKEIKDNLKNNASIYVTTTSAIAHNNEDIKRHSDEDKILNDHETRIRSIESQITRIMTWGSTVLVILTVVQIILHFYGK